MRFSLAGLLTVLILCPRVFAAVGPEDYFSTDLSRRSISAELVEQRVVPNLERLQAIVVRLKKVGDATQRLSNAQVIPLMPATSSNRGKKIVATSGVHLESNLPTYCSEISFVNELDVVRTGGGLLCKTEGVLLSIFVSTGGELVLLMDTGKPGEKGFEVLDQFLTALRAVQPSFKISVIDVNEKDLPAGIWIGP